jgi:DNA-binding LacI/PurR family transcriptional regulator
MPVTLNEIAREAGVSTCTVSRVLNGKHKEVYQPAARRAARIRDVAARLGFVPNASARAMQRNSTQLIGLLVPEAPLTSLVDYETILGINNGLEAEGYVLALTRSSELTHALALSAPRAGTGRLPDGETPTTFRHPSRVFHERMVDGMVVLGLISPAMSRLVARVAPACLWIDTNVEHAQNCLRRDEVHAGRLVASQLVARGYRKLVFVGSVYNDGQPHYSSIDRLRGIVDVAKDGGVPLQEINIVMSGRERIAETLGPMLAHDVGVIASSDHIATAILAQMSRSSFRVGIDFGLASCDRTEVTRRHWPGLSCVDVKRDQLGQQAARMMMEILHGPPHQCPSQTIRWAWHEGDTTPDVRRPNH